MNDKMQEKIAQFKMLQNTLGSLEQREKMISAAIEELDRARLALEDIKNSKGQAYIPLGANNFILGKIEDNQNVLMSIGSGIAVKKKREEALKITEDRIKEITQEATKVVREMQHVTSMAIKLQDEIEELRK